MPYFLIFTALMLTFYKALHIAWHRGYRACRDQHFTCILRPDDSVRQRL